MNRKQITLIVLVTVILIGGAFWHLKNKQVMVREETKESSQSLEKQEVTTSSWKTYLNKGLGFEFKYPDEMNPVLDLEPGSIWGTEDEVMEELSLVRNEKSVLWVLHTSKESLAKNREKLKELSDLSEKKGESKILQDEAELLIHGTKVTRINYCSYSVAGVNCDSLMSEYYFPLQDGTYMMMRADSWWSTKEDRSSLADIANSFKFVLVEK